MLIADRYELGEIIGTGGMSDVYAATDVSLGRQVAVKMLKIDLARDENFRERFRRVRGSDDDRAYSLGALIALYEHIVFTEAAIWDINAFDQWGVELGKQQANDLAAAVSGEESPATGDASTDALITWYREHR